MDAKRIRALRSEVNAPSRINCSSYHLKKNTQKERPAGLDPVGPSNVTQEMKCG